MKVPQHFGCSHVLIPLQTLWISHFQWHYKARSFPGYPGTKSRPLSPHLQPKGWEGAGGKLCLATRHGSFTLPFWEAGMTFAVPSTGRAAIPAWLTSTFEPPLSKTKVQLPKAGNLQHGKDGTRLLNAICLLQVSFCIEKPQRATKSHLCEPAGPLACLLLWLGSPGSPGSPPSRAPTGNRPLMP